MATRKKFIFGTNNNEIQPFYFRMPEIHVTDLSHEIIYRVFLFLIPDYQCDFREFLKLRLICHQWKNIIDEPYIWIFYAKDIGIYGELHKKFLIKNNISIFLETKYQTLNKTNDIQLLKSIFNQKKILEYDLYYKVLRYYPPKILDIIGSDTLANAPVLHINDRCLDHVCGGTCCYHNHYIDKQIQKFKSPIMRGFDNTGRPFILFVYKNLVTEELIYEFIYNNFTRNYRGDIPYSLWTYIGQFSNTYIGSLSYKTNNYNIFTNTFRNNTNRNLLRKSYNYIKRLVAGDDCGIPIYENKYDNYWEYGLCQESKCPTFHTENSNCKECIYCENCHHENQVTLYWKDGYLGDTYIEI